MRQSDVTHFRMQQTMQQFPIPTKSPANPRADREIKHRFTPLPRAPAVFGQRRGIDIRIEGHGDIEGLAEMAKHVRILPSRFGRGGDFPIIRRARRDPRRSKGPNANGGNPSVQLLAMQQMRRDRSKGGLGICRGKADNFPKVLRPGADGADKLCATSFNGGKEGRHGQ